MNIGKLSIGQTIKNYKELCSILEESIKAGKAKQLQLSEWETYFTYSKQGNAFIIEKIYKVPKSKLTKRFGLVNHIEELILNLLVNENGTAFFSKSKLFNILNMVNLNYNYGRYNIDKLSKYLQIPQESIEEFYELTSEALQRSTESGLNRLKNKSLVFWTHAKTVCIANVNEQRNAIGQIKNKKRITRNEYDEKITEYNPKVVSYQTHREATEEEVKAIIHIERDILKELNCSTKQDIIKRGKWEEFRIKVDTYLFEHYNIDYYYDSYKIIFNMDHVIEMCIELENFSLSEADRILRESELNDGIIDKLTDNAELRHTKSIVKLDTDEENVSDKDKRRSSYTYLEDNDELIHHLIDDEPLVEFKQFRNKLRATWIKS